ILPMHHPDAIRRRAEIWNKKFVAKVQEQYNVTILEQHREGSKLQYKTQCNKCSEVFEQQHQGYFLCPVCFPRLNGTSLSEQALMDSLVSYFGAISYKRNCRDILPSG